MAVDTTLRLPAAKRSPADAPVVVEVRDVKKTFRLPGQKVDSLKERVLHPFSNREFKEFRALDGISFDVHRGEFFGIVGRNGSGKSTLLKILASIYRADAGSVRMAGTLAPFIELGVGFNMELTARQNVQLNGVMMGLPRGQAADLLSAVLDFAELEEFVDLKLKNYSSGMLVRLAFSVMLQADPDILLIDEVLAVGDAAFQQKCNEALQAMKNAGKTIILVTHDMGAVQTYCHRAILIEGGHVLLDGEPAAVGSQYLRINFQEQAAHAARSGPVKAEDAKLLDLWLEDSDGKRQPAVRPGDRIRLNAEVEGLRDVPDPYFSFILSNAAGANVFSCGTGLDPEAGGTSLRAGERVVIRSEVENSLTPGGYTIHFSVARGDNGEHALWVPYLSDFSVLGELDSGLVTPKYTASARKESR